MTSTISVASRADPPTDDLWLQFPLPERGKGVFGSFLGHCSDGRRRWIKVLNNPPNQPKTLVAELVAARLGRLISAPVCDVTPVWIPAAHAGYEFVPGHVLLEGFASGSADVPNTTELRSLEHRFDDDNQTRHVGVFATWDWCFGADPQWLYEGTAQNATWAHDHGLFLWSGELSGPGISTPASTAQACPADPSGLDPATVANVAASLRAVSAPQVSAVLKMVPVSWPATDTELEQLGNLLLERAPKVADRLEALIAP